MKNCSQYELVKRLHSDDVKAFEILYHSYHKALYLNILKLCRNDEAAQDILQEVFITLWEKRFTIDPGQPVSNWLFSISYNKSINYLKKSLRQSLVIKDCDTSAVPAPEMEINLREMQLHLIDEAINRLSPQKRKVFHRCKLEGKTYAETAMELNISKHTVKEYLSEAVHNVREYVKNHPMSLTVFIGSLRFLFLSR